MQTSRPRHKESEGQVLVLICLALSLAAAVYFMLAPLQKSRQIRANETAAARLLVQIEDLQRKARTQGSYQLLEELLVESDLPLELVAHDQPGKFIPIARKSGYLFCIYIAGKDHTPISRPETTRARGDFFIAYAWPIAFGETGRRILVIDNAKHLRFWDNDPGIFDGGRRIPAAHLATAPEGLTYPLERPRLGFLREAQWRNVESP